MLYVYGWTARIFGPSLALLSIVAVLGGHLRDEWALGVGIALAFVGFALGLTGEIILARLRRSARA